MGNYNITISGVGAHHNGKPEVDADLIAARTVAELRAAGHTIVSASITYGAAQDLDPHRVMLDAIAGMTPEERARHTATGTVSTLGVAGAGTVTLGTPPKP